MAESNHSHSIIAAVPEPELAPDQQTLELEPLDGSKSSQFGSFSRRSFLGGLGATGLIASASPLGAATPVLEPPATDDATATTIDVTLKINGKEYTLHGLDTRLRTGKTDQLEQRVLSRRYRLSRGGTGTQPGILKTERGRLDAGKWTTAPTLALALGVY